MERWGGPSAEVLDFRRSLHRDYGEAILRFARALPEDERSLLEAVYGRGLSVKDVAGLVREEPRRLARRVKRLVERLLSPRFAFVYARRHAWPPRRRRVAETVVLHGRSMREACDALALSLHTVRRELDKVDALFEIEGRD